GALAVTGDLAGPALAVRDERGDVRAAVVRHPQPARHFWGLLEGFLVAVEVALVVLDDAGGDLAQLAHALGDGLGGEGWCGCGCGGGHVPPIPTLLPAASFSRSGCG